MRLKVLSYNMHKGFCLRNRRYVIETMRSALQAVDADIVFLQEIRGQHPSQAQRNSRGNDRQSEFLASGQSQCEFLAGEKWSHHVYKRNAVYTDGDHGNAILSKYRFRHRENVNISTNRFERRGLLHAVVDLPDGRELHLACTHLNLLQRGRQQQVERIAKYLQQHVPEDAPLIVAGDFNDWRSQATPTLAEQLGLHDMSEHLHGSHARTFPSFLPVLRLDRIYQRGAQPMRCDALSSAPWNKLSDHSALSAALQLPPRLLTAPCATKTPHVAESPLRATA